MIIFLYGPDSYRSRQKLNEIIVHYQEVHKSGLNLKHFDGEKLDYGDLKNEFQHLSMFDEKRLVILKNVFANQGFKQLFLEDAVSYKDTKDTILFHEENKILKADPLFVFLQKNASRSQEFKLLTGQGLKNWAQKELAKYSIKADPQALETLVRFVGNDLWQLSNEILKCAAYKKKGIIGKGEVELLVRPKVETDIFRTIRALAFKNRKQALTLIRKHLEKGDPPRYLLAMINYQFRTLLTRERSYLFTPEELRRIYRKIFETDLKIKTGQLDPQLALDLLITEI